MEKIKTANLKKMRHLWRSSFNQYRLYFCLSLMQHNIIIFMQQLIPSQMFLLFIPENLRTFMLAGARNSAQRTTAHHPLPHHKRNSPADLRSQRVKTRQWKRRRLLRLRNRKQWRLRRWKKRKMMTTKMIRHYWINMNSDKLNYFPF